MLQKLSFNINNNDVSLDVSPGVNLSRVLRENLFLTGTKQGCMEGECGACTVLLDGKPVNACLVPAMKANGKKIITIEGLTENGELHPIQEAFMEAGAVQCGFCTPGVILSAKALLDMDEMPSEELIRDELSGHLCRCTGYAQFIDAINLAAQKLKNNK